MYVVWFSKTLPNLINAPLLVNSTHLFLHCWGSFSYIYKGLICDVMSPYCTGDTLAIFKLNFIMF